MDIKAHAPLQDNLSFKTYSIDPQGTPQLDANYSLSLTDGDVDPSFVPTNSLKGLSALTSDMIQFNPVP